MKFIRFLGKIKSLAILFLYLSSFILCFGAYILEKIHSSNVFLIIIMALAMSLLSIIGITCFLTAIATTVGEYKSYKKAFEVHNRIISSEDPYGEENWD